MASPLFLQCLLNDLGLQAFFGIHLLEPPVLVFEFLESGHQRGVHAAEFAAPFVKRMRDCEKPNVEVTGAARLYRVASVWTAGLGAVDSTGSISDNKVSGAMSCSLGQVTAPNRMPTRLK